MRRELLLKLSEKIRDLGASNCAVIPAEEVETDRSFREMCEANSCGLFGKCWTCPPDVGEIDEMMAQLSEYSDVLVFQMIGELEDSFDYEGMTLHKKRHHRLTQRVREMLDAEGLSGQTLLLGSGGCELCEVCAKLMEEPCRFPDRAVRSLEAYGIFVSRLAESAGMKYINGRNTVTYFGAVFVKP